MRGYVVYEDVVMEAELKELEGGHAYVTKCGDKFFAGKNVPPGNWCITKDKALYIAEKELRAEVKNVHRRIEQADEDHERRVWEEVLVNVKDLLGRAVACELPIVWLT